jgi:hypothetical protein
MSWRDAHLSTWWHLNPRRVLAERYIPVSCPSVGGTALRRWFKWESYMHRQTFFASTVPALVEEEDEVVNSTCSWWPVK